MAIAGNNEIVIGSNLSAFIYSFCNGVPFVASRQLIPHDFDFFPATTDLSLYGINNPNRSLLSPKGQFDLGSQKKILWHQLNFLLSLAGKNLMPFPIASIKIDDGVLKVLTPNARMGVFKYNKLTIFDEHKVLNVPKECITSINKFKVYDYVDVHSGQKHALDFVETEYNLVKQIHFYKTTRNLNTRANWKDALSISYATTEDLHNFDWTDTGVMFRVKNIMKENGIRGTRNGRDPNRPGFFKHYAIRVSHRKRDIEEVREGTNYIVDNLEFRYDKPEELISQLDMVPSDMRTMYSRLKYEEASRQI